MTIHEPSVDTLFAVIASGARPVDDVPAVLHTDAVIELPLSLSEAKRLDAMGTELDPHHRSPGSHSSLHIERARNELALLALKQTPIKPIHYDQQRIDAAVAWYHQHMEQRVGVPDMAEAVHVSVAHLRRLFMRHRRLPPQSVMRRLQIQRAQELMMSTHLPLSHIARACGFSCLSAFSRSHQELTGLAPSARRNAAGAGAQYRAGRSEATKRTGFATALLSPHPSPDSRPQASEEERIAVKYAPEVSDELF